MAPKAWARCVYDNQVAKSAFDPRTLPSTFIFGSDRDEYSKDAIDHFAKFLDAVRRRLQLTSTVTEAYRVAGDAREPFDEGSVTRGKFLGEFGLNVEGLIDLVSKAQLKMSPTGLGFLPLGSINLLPETALLAMAEASATNECV